MTMTDTGVKPIPAYVPPEDGKPRNAVDEKWMRLHRAMMNHPETAPFDVIELSRIASITRKTVSSLTRFKATPALADKEAR